MVHYINLSDMDKSYLRRDWFKYNLDLIYLHIYNNNLKPNSSDEHDFYQSYTLPGKEDLFNIIHHSNKFHDVVSKLHSYSLPYLSELSLSNYGTAENRLEDSMKMISKYDLTMRAKNMSHMEWYNLIDGSHQVNALLGLPISNYLFGHVFYFYHTCYYSYIADIEPEAFNDIIREHDIDLLQSQNMRAIDICSKSDIGLLFYDSWNGQYDWNAKIHHSSNIIGASKVLIDNELLNLT